MLFNGRGAVAADAHSGFVAGRYRSGVWSDEWTEVSRCAERTFTAYAPGCVCGWRGPARPATPDGYLACQRAWVFEDAPRPALIPAAGGPPDRVRADLGADAVG